MAVIFGRVILPAVTPHSLIVRRPALRRSSSESSRHLTRDYTISITSTGALIGEWEPGFLDELALIMAEEGISLGRAPELPEPFDMADLEEQRDDVADDLNVERVHLTGPGLLP